MKRIVNASTKDKKAEFFDALKQEKANYGKHDQDYSNGFCDAVVLIDKAFNVGILEEFKNHQKK